MSINIWYVLVEGGGEEGGMFVTDYRCDVRSTLICECLEVCIKHYCKYLFSFEETQLLGRYAAIFPFSKFSFQL